MKHFDSFKKAKRFSINSDLMTNRSLVGSCSVTNNTVGGVVGASGDTVATKTPDLS